MKSRATRQVDVGLEERQADLAERLLDVVLGDPGLARELAQEALEALGESFEHRDRRIGVAAKRAYVTDASPFVHAGDGR